jgi:hypothetical protein
MSEDGLRSARFFEGYLITNTGTRVRIVTTSYHALPLELGAEELATLGLRITIGADGRPLAGPTQGRRLSSRARGESAGRPGRR